ncbi:GreA/GreB family elongation factor [Photobacterium damselae]|uniref:GreA/GreB family elongation factor n=1 Tax=Photobacterium damselae TaxID=38293 RepID=UPI001EED72D1|nr:GreA/GreB family elongation factor [Photobacterium damselae]UKA04643.1 GreA/GreB family elongation factor [Photobacterium damselae subsp. damselae]
MFDKKYISLQGYNKQVEELSKKRAAEKQICVQIAESRERELSSDTENVELLSLMAEKNALQEQISDIEQFCVSVIVVDLNTLPASTNVVKFGSTVEMINIETEETKSFTILGERESDLKNNIVSYSSPIGMAMLNNGIGEIIGIEAPKGLIEYEIVSIKKYNP